MPNNKARIERTKKLIEAYKGLPGEFMMLKGLLCMSHTDDKVLKNALDGYLVAVRMDEINGITPEARG